MVEELSKLHDHVGEALGGEWARPAGAVEGVRDLPWVRKGGAVAGCRHTVSVQGRGQSPHGDAGGSPSGLGQVVAATVQAPDLVARCPQPFQNIFPVTDIATYRLNQPRGQCSENHVKCITRWKGRDGVTITIFFQHTRDGHETGYL